MHSRNEQRPVIVIGGGGHAKVLVSTLRAMGVRSLQPLTMIRHVTAMNCWASRSSDRSARRN
ncbi:MAG: hypothetical protein R3B91_14755 [Planctomycetaceae bacterium]